MRHVFWRCGGRAGGGCRQWELPVVALGCRRDWARVLIYAHKNAYRPRLPPALEAQASPGNEDELEC